MARLKRDSAFIEILAAEDGYFVRAWRWNVTPPPIPHRDLDRDSNPQPTFRIDNVVEDKAELKAALNAFITNILGDPGETTPDP